MDINNVIKDYVTCTTNDGVTLPDGGSWISALCIYYNITEPVNGSWLVAYCNYLGITVPVYGSYTIALAQYLGVTAPENNSWWYAIANEACNGTPFNPCVWGVNTNTFGTETRIWSSTTECSVPVLDPDASAYLTATNTISDVTISDAVNQLVLDLKAAGIWSKLDAAYPFAGSTATQHGYNLLDPQNTNAAYYLTWAGGWTHTLDGPKGNGSNTYADTHWPTLAYADGTHMSTYNTVASDYFKYDVGNTGPDWALIVAYQAGRSYYQAGGGGYLNVTGNLDVGFAGASSNGTNNGSNLRYLHRDGSQVTQDTAGSVTLSTGNLSFGAANQTPAAPSNGEYTWFSFGSEFINNTEMTAMYNAVETYKIAMSR